jgi:hypothetical protein
VNNGTDFVAEALRKLTDGLATITESDENEFNLGPIAEFGSNLKIASILDRFGLDFTSFIDEFKLDFDSFKNNLEDNDANADRLELFELKPPSFFARFGSVLQIGSKKPSHQLSPSLKYQIWLKLSTKFPSYIYNGVPVPGLPIGKSFEDIFGDGSNLGSFNVRDFLPAIAVAYGKAPSFSDKRATRFSLDDLFTPEFGPDLSTRLLDKLRSSDATNFSTIFNGFDTTDQVTGLPMESATKKLFDVKLYLPEIQVALQLSPSVDLTAKRFMAQNIRDALFPNPVPTVKSFSSFIKRKIIPQIKNALTDFDLTLSPPSTTAIIGSGGATGGGGGGGFTLDTPTIGQSGTNFGTFSETSTQLFPPSIDIDSIQVWFVYCSITVLTTTKHGVFPPRYDV